MIEYRKGNLFDNVTGAELIVHACNGMGIWGSGFALECKEKYYWAYEEFVEYLNLHKKRYNPEAFYHICQYSLWTTQSIGCIVTSVGYGKYKDTPGQIALNTKIALKLMLSSYHKDIFTVFSPKMNAGLFNVPWKYTETAIKIALQMVPKSIKWVVWEL